MDLHAYFRPVAFSVQRYVIPNCPLPNSFSRTYIELISTYCLPRIFPTSGGGGGALKLGLEEEEVDAMFCGVGL